MTSPFRGKSLRKGSPMLLGPVGPELLTGLQGTFLPLKNLDGVMAHKKKIRGVKLKEIQLATLKKMVINEGRMMNLSKNLEG